MTNKRKLIFIYNAKGGKWNYIVDTLHKYISPKTYECKLCQITYDLKMRTTWREFVENSPHEFIFLHSEELDNFGLSDFQDKLPICLEKVDDIKYNILVSKEEMNEFSTEIDLINALENKLKSNNS